LRVEGFLSFSRSIVFDSSSDAQTLWLPNGYIKYPSEENRQLCLFQFAIIANLAKGIAEISSLKSHSEEISAIENTPTFLEKLAVKGYGLYIQYDEHSQTLKIYRDFFGRVPLYYVFVPNKFLAFSTSLTSLLKMYHVRENITADVNTILQYSQFTTDSRTYCSEHTFYNEVKAVLPGHMASFESTHAKSLLSISFNTSKWAHLRSLEEYGEAFSHLFRKSVSSVIKDEREIVSSHLSGGLDSSSISAVYKYLYPDRPLYTLYGSTGNNTSDEIHYARLVATQIGSIHHEVSPSQNHLEYLLNHTAVYGHPQRTIIAGTFQGTLMEYAKSLGASTLLNGHPGDSIVGSGFSLIHEGIMNRSWSLTNELLRQRASYAHSHPKFDQWLSFSEKKKYELLSGYFLFKELPGMYRKVNFWQFIVFVKEVLSHTNLSFGYFLSEISRVALNKLSFGTTGFFTLANDNILLLPPRQPTPIFAENSFWASGIYTTQAIGLNEETFALDGFYGIKNRFPFYDQDLYELSLAVPEIIKFDKGRGRGHLREAMKGILPEAVRVRTDKGQFVSYNDNAVLKLYQQSGDFLGPSNEVWNYLDRKKFETAAKFVQDNKNVASSNAVLVLRAISLSVWLHLVKYRAFV
jgi:asparagine synthase (glutamine-hydrolysing)